MRMETTLLLVLAALLVVAGMAGTIVPLIPGIPMVFGGLLLAAWAEGFAKVGAWPLVAIGALAVLSLGIDLVATLLGAKKVGASPQALVGATLGGVAGIFLGIPGLLLGPFLGAVAGEFYARRTLGQAGKVGLGTWLGLVLGAIAKIAVGFLMIGIFFAAWLFSV
jgi:uncharacterized protein YqgC (DUF456 family)